MSKPVHIHQVVSGNGPALVVLHGLFGDGDNLRSVSLHMERQLQVTRLDLPAHGRSATLPSLGIETMAEAISDHLLHNGISECHLLGHSMGGKVAMAIASSSRGPQINKLIVADIAPRYYPPHYQEYMLAMISLDLEALLSRSAADKQLRESIPDAGVRAFLIKSLYRNQAGQFAWRFDINGLYRDYEQLRQVPVFENQVSAPTLFIKGGKSDYLQEQDEPVIRKHFADPHLREIRGASHWLHAEKPAVFTRLCLEFLGHG